MARPSQKGALEVRGTAEGSAQAGDPTLRWSAAGRPLKGPGSYVSVGPPAPCASRPNWVE